MSVSNMITDIILFPGQIHLGGFYALNTLGATFTHSTLFFPLSYFFIYLYINLTSLTCQEYLLGVKHNPGQPIHKQMGRKSHLQLVCSRKPLTFFSLIYSYIHVFQDTLQLLICILLLSDLSVTLLILIEFYWISLGAFLAVLLILPLSLLSPFPAGLNAIFSRGHRRASLARIYALWNATSLSNIVSFHHVVEDYQVNMLLLTLTLI